MKKCDEASPNIIWAGQALFVKMLITLEPDGIFYLFFSPFFAFFVNCFWLFFSSFFSSFFFLSFLVCFFHFFFFFSFSLFSIFLSLSFF